MDWHIVTIGDHFDFKNGLNKGKSFFGYGTPIVNYTDVYRGGGIKATNLKGRVHLTKDEIKRFEVRKGDVFFTRTSETPDEVGLANVMLDDVKDCVFSGFVLRARQKGDFFETAYCKYCFTTEAVRNAIVSGCTYTTRALTNGRQLSGIKILLPKIREQTAIAEALSDADSLIASLQQLISKKKAIKKGAMQELLTGKRRLPGFSGEWKKTTLSTCIDKFVGGGTPSRGIPTYWCGGIPWATVKDFATFNVRSTQETITSLGLANSAANLIPAGTLITSTRMGLGKIFIYDVDVAINQDLKALFTSKYSSKMFLYHWFIFNQTKIEELGTGSTVKGIRLEHLRALNIFLPEMNEQLAIAKIFSDMDAEIEQLEKKLSKYQQVKQGMVQELLTGRIRLIDPEPKQG